MKSGENIGNSAEQIGSGEKTDWDTVKDEVQFAGESSDNKKVEARSNSQEKEKPVGELTHDEASKEYLDVLMQLSANFTSPEAKASNAVRENGTLDPRGAYDYGKSGSMSFEAIKSLTSSEDSSLSATSAIFKKREYTLHLADRIIDEETQWREVSAEEVKETKDALNKESYIMGRLEDGDKKYAGKDDGNYSRKGYEGHLEKKEEQQHKLEKAREKYIDMLAETGKINDRLGRAIDMAYNEDHNWMNHETNTAKSEEYNQRFFSPDREGMIDRAIELRKRLVEDHNESLKNQKQN